MPQTRGDNQHQYFYQPTSTEVSPTNVSFSVSELFRDQSNPHPIRSSKAVRECLNDVAFCMGERISTNSRFTVSPTTLPTGTYGQEANFRCDPHQRNKEGYTIGRIIKMAKEAEDRVWETAEGRNQIRKSLADLIRQNPIDRHIHEQQSNTNTSSGPTETTTERDRNSLGRDEKRQRYDKGEIDRNDQRETGRIKNPGRIDYKRGESYPQYDYGTIAPSQAMGWLIHEASYSSTSGME